MSQEFYHYSEKMRAYLQYLEKRIESLEKKIENLTKDFTVLKEKPSIHIDQIAYSFDQLKVETLDGTLNIGLNPADLEKIEELSIQSTGTVNTPGGTFYPPIDPKQMMNRSMEIEESLLSFIQLELPEIIMTKQKELGLEDDESYVHFIQEDVTKQLPTRIQYYLQQNHHPISTDEERNNLIEKIIQSLRMEIENGVHQFLSHLPDNMKGRQKE